MPARPRMRDYEVVQAFVSFLAVTRIPGLRIERRPDMERDGDIDAVAGSLAIEHTIIDTLPNQRRDEARHLEVFRTLESELALADAPTWVLLPNGALEAGENWDKTRDHIRQYLEPGAIRELPVGVHSVRVE